MDANSKLQEIIDAIIENIKPSVSNRYEDKMTELSADLLQTFKELELK